MNVFGANISCINKKSIPLPDETINHDIDIEMLVPFVSRIRIYFRDREACPFNRGNWIIDVFGHDNQVIPFMCVKLPAQMQRQEVERWCRPLIELISETGK